MQKTVGDQVLCLQAIQGDNSTDNTSFSFSSSNNLSGVAPASVGRKLRQTLTYVSPPHFILHLFQILISSLLLCLQPVLSVGCEGAGVEWI